MFDWQERLWADGQTEEGWNETTCLREMDLEPVDYDLDISREVGPPIEGE